MAFAGRSARTGTIRVQRLDASGMALGEPLEATSVVGSLWHPTVSWHIVAAGDEWLIVWSEHEVDGWAPTHLARFRACP